MPGIKSLSSLSELFHSLRAGDSIYFDIDDTLLLMGTHKFTGPALATEKNLALELNRLQAAGITVYGLTARGSNIAAETSKQLKSLGLNITNIIYAPSTRLKTNKIGRKGIALKRHLDMLNVHPKRVIVVDDTEMQLEDIARECADYNLQLYHYARPQKILDLASNHIFPDTLDDYAFFKQLKTTNINTYVLQNQHGNMLILKPARRIDAMKIEILCKCIYRTLGIFLPEIAAYNRLPTSLAKFIGLKSPHGIFQITPFINDTQNANANKLIREFARHHFIALALMGNTNASNPEAYSVNPAGSINIADVNANFIFDADGNARSESPDVLSELISLRVSKTNNDYEWFKDLTEAELTQQVRDIISMQDKLAKLIWDVSAKLDMAPKLRDKFITTFARRLSVLVDSFHVKEQTLAQPDKPAIPGKTAAGILTYAIIAGKPHVLLSQQPEQNSWNIFGGKSKTEDSSLLQTAIREVAEKSNNYLQYNKHELSQCPSHDLVSKNPNGTSFTYRMYFAKHSQVDLTKVGTWIPADELLRATMQSPTIVAGEASCEVTLPNQQGAPLHVPLCRMLTQPAVMAHLQNLANNQDLKMTHTRSYLGKLTPSGTNARTIATPKLIHQQTTRACKNYQLVLSELKTTLFAQPSVQRNKNVELQQHKLK